MKDTVHKSHRKNHLLRFSHSHWFGLNKCMFIIAVQVENANISAFGNPYCHRVSIQHAQLSLVVEKKRPVGLRFNAKILNYRGSSWEEREPEENFIEGLCAYFSPGILLSAPAPLSQPLLLLEWCTFVHLVTSSPLFPDLFSLLSVSSSTPQPRTTPTSTLFPLPRWL